MRSMASGEGRSPSPDGSETMGTSEAPGRGPSEIFAFAPTFAAFAALAGARTGAAAGSGCDDVVNPKHHDRRVRRRGDGLAPDADGLDHVLLLHVGDLAAEDVDPRGLVPLLVLLAQLDQDVDRVQACVLREGPRDDLDGVRERLDGDLLAPTHGRCEVSKGQGNLHCTRTAARDDLTVLDRDRDDARRVLEGPLELVDHVLRAAAQENRDRLRVLASRHERHLVVANLLLVDLLGEAQVVLRQLVELRHDLATGRLRELLHVRFLDPAHCVDLLLRQVVLREVVDALLAEDHGRAALPHDLDHALQHRLFLVQKGLELGRVRDLDLRVDLGLLDLEGRVDEGDLGVLHFARHPGVHALLVDDDAVDQLRVRNGSALLLDDLNVVIVDEVRSVNKQGGSIADTQLVDGIIVDKERVHPGMPSEVRDAKIALVDAALEVKKTEIDAKIEITDPTQLQAFLNEEEAMLKRMVEIVRKSGATVIFCQKGIDDLAQHYLAKQEIYAVRRVKKSDMEKLAKATGGKVVTKLDELAKDDLGFAKQVYEKKIGDDEMTFVTGCKNPKAVSILLRGGTEHVVDELERSLEDATSVVAVAIEDGKVISGGGSSAMEIALALRDFASTVGGREQMAIEAFADAVEVIPRTLAENAGLDPIDILIELRQQHKKGNKTAGINVFSGKVSDMKKENVIEPIRVGSQAISSATDAAVMVLRIDDVIAARSGGGAGPGAGKGGEGGEGGGEGEDF